MKKFLKKKLGNNISRDLLHIPFALIEIPTNQESNTGNNKDETDDHTGYENKIVKTKELKFSNIHSFIEIDLCKNILIKIYPSIGFLNYTTTLKLCCNNLTEIPPEIGYMKNLEILNVANNKIEQIPDTICFLNGLIKLDISNNNIREIPVVLRKLLNLTHLNLKGNEIEMLPSEIGELINLVSLNLADNPIQYLPIELNKITNLTELNIDNCPLASSFEECRPAFILSSDIKDLIVSRNQKLLLESSRYQNNATLDMLNELEQYKKYYSNSSSLSISCEQNHNNFSIFDFNHSLNKNFSCHCHFFNDIMLNKRIGVNSSSTTLNQEIETETLSLSDDDDDNNTIEEPINNENKIELKIPTLKELAARTIVRNHLSMSTNLLHDDLLNYLSSYKTCSFCHGPYFETYIRRVRIMYKEGREIPYEYRLCRVHFNSNEERIKEMFKIRPITAPRPSSMNSLENRNDKKYKYNEVSTSGENSACTLNNTVVPDTSSSSIDLTISKLSLSSTSSSPPSSINTKHKGSVKHIFSIKSKHRKSSKDSIDSVESTPYNNKRYSNREINDLIPSKSVTVNELLSMKQPSLPSLHYPVSNTLRNI